MVYPTQNEWMKHKSETFPFVKGNYLILKHSGTDLLIVKVTGIDTHKYFVGYSKIQLKLITDKHLGQDGQITWDFEYLSPALVKVIQSPTEIRLLKLLYD